MYNRGVPKRKTNVTKTQTRLTELKANFKNFIYLADELLADGDPTGDPNFTELNHAITSLEKRLDEVKYWIK